MMLLRSTEVSTSLDLALGVVPFFFAEGGLIPSVSSASSGLAFLGVVMAERGAVFFGGVLNRTEELFGVVISKEVGSVNRLKMITTMGDA